MNIIEIFNTFPTQEDCIRHIELKRWGNKPICPYCGSDRTTKRKKELRHQCNSCNISFSATVRTIFHNTKLPLQKWFLAISLILNAKKGVSSRQLARDLNVTKDTAWRMQMQIRRAMIEYGDLLRGIVEIDETYIGGKPRKDGTKHKRGRGTKKTPVVGVVERKGRVKAMVQLKDKLKFKHLKRMVREHVEISETILISDDYRGYIPFKNLMVHKTINHSAKQYVNGDIHTNTIEGFWSLLKRGIVGQYHKVSIKYLNKYINEFCFRYNNRDHKNLFDLLLTKAVVY